MKPNRLQSAVIKQIGHTIADYHAGKYNKAESELFGVLRDVYNHGANTGWHGFTYYTDTVDFVKRNRPAIMGLVRDWAEETGQDPVDFIMSFNCFRHAKADGDEMPLREAAGRFVYGGHYREDDKCDSLAIYNALAWFALEETARALTEGGEA